MATAAKIAAPRVSAAVSEYSMGRSSAAHRIVRHTRLAAPPPVKIDYDLGSLPEGFYVAAFRMNGHFYTAERFRIHDPGFEAEVDLSVEVGDAGDDVLLKAVACMQEFIPQLQSDGVLKGADAKVQKILEAEIRSALETLGEDELRRAIL